VIDDEQPAESFKLGPATALVQPNGAQWGKSPHLPRVPTLREMCVAIDPLIDDYPVPPDPYNELVELLELAQLRDDPNALISVVPGRERKRISRFLLQHPQPYGAAYDETRPVSAPAIQTGRELARWFESETPGMPHRHALNYLFKHLPHPPLSQARIWAALDVCIYGALLAAWYYKWEDPRTRYRPRPIELCPELSVLYNFSTKQSTVTDGIPKTSPSPSPGTPRHPAYPAGHSIVGAAASEVLSYFFPDFRSDFDDLADNTGMARLWAGIHYRSDHRFGNAAGRAVAKLVIERLRRDGAN
jgi:hypothetical protein